jgi:hypothetical protein
MGIFDEIEPTLSAVQGIKSLPADKPLVVVSLMRLRHDLPDGRADTAWKNYQSAILPILEEYGARRIVQATVALALIGPPGQWDVMGAFWYPNPIILWRFMSDERVMELVKGRRTAVDDVNMLILHDIHGTLGL